MAADTTAIDQVAIIKTSEGEMAFEFYPDIAPSHVENFKRLAKKGFYDGTCFHRVIKGFMIQGGDPNTKNKFNKDSWGQGGPGYTIKAEFNSKRHERGTLSMARTSDPDSAGSQFFICHGDAGFLDGQYTVFGKLIKGDDVLEKISITPTEGQDRPINRINVESIRIIAVSKQRVPIPRSDDAAPQASGTGFFITDDGCLISNYHVIKGAEKVRLLTGTGLVDAMVVKVDAANDLALLKAAIKSTPLPIAASRTAKLGATVATVGFPSTGLQGFSPKLTKGEIGSLAGIRDDPRHFQISVPVQPGNSGGALVDARGNVVGVVSAKLSAKAALDATGQLPENVNYAVKSSLLLSFLESVPDVSAKLKEPLATERNFEDVVKSAQDAAVLVLVY